MNPAAPDKCPTDAGRRPEPGKGAKLPVANAALRLGMVLQLARRVRRASRNEQPFVLVNETRQLLPYRQAVLWVVKHGTPSLEALSGLAAVDRNSPYVSWMNAFFKQLLAPALSRADREAGESLRFSLTGEELPEAFSSVPCLKEYGDFVPPHVLAASLRDPAGHICAYLCLFRESPFNEGEEQVFSHLAESYGDSFGGAMLRPRRVSLFGRRKVLAAAALAALAVLLLIPRPQSGLAGAEVVARRPAIIRAEVDGVLEGILVESNQRVEPGQALLRLEDSQLRTRLAVAEKAGEMAQVELRQLQQSALYDPAAKARVPLAQGRVEQLQAEADYVKGLLDRVVSHSPMSGVALVDNPDEWRGRPVSLGQKIMMVADPDDVMLEIHLPAADALPLSPGDELLFFPNIAPASPLRARISSVAYRAVETPGLGMAFHLRAEFLEDAPMLGLRGTARLNADPLPLGMIILRRPIMAVRQWMGW